MQDRVAARREEARALKHEGAKVEEALPAFAHRVLLVRAIPVEKETLEEDREPPVPDEK
jgi:hypothetical protein